MNTHNLSFEDVNELLSYNPDTGELTWKVDRGGKAKAGTIAGSIDVTTGYITLMVKGTKQQSHRIAWLLQTGEWPKCLLDHVNGVRTDNRLINLREATHSQNSQNKKIRSDSRSGVKGLWYLACSRSWQAQVVIEGKMHSKTSVNKKIVVEWLEQKRYEVHGEFANFGEFV